MDLTLNKIDAELRRKVNDATKEGKIHGNKGIQINKQTSDNEENHKNFERKLKKYKKKIEVEATLEEVTDSSKGVFLDTRK